MRLSRGAYGKVSIPLLHTLLVSHVVFYVLVIALSILGIVAAQERKHLLLPCFVLETVVAVHVVANASTRFRVPWMPLLVVYGSYAVVAWRSLLGRLRGWRTFVAVALILYLPRLVRVIFLSRRGVPVVARDLRRFSVTLKKAEQPTWRREIVRPATWDSIGTVCPALEMFKQATRALFTLGRLSGYGPVFHGGL